MTAPPAAALPAGSEARARRRSMSRPALPLLLLLAAALASGGDHSGDGMQWSGGPQPQGDGSGDGAQWLASGGRQPQQRQLRSSGLDVWASGSDGSYIVAVDGAPWLESAPPDHLGRSLAAIDLATSSGEDKHGTFDAVTVRWRLNTTGADVPAPGAAAGGGAACNSSSVRWHPGVQLHDIHPASDLANRGGMSAEACAAWCCEVEACVAFFHTANQLSAAGSCKPGGACCWLKPTFNASRTNDTCATPSDCRSGVLGDRADGLLHTTLRVYTNAEMLAFTQRWPAGVANTSRFYNSSTAANLPLGRFPAFQVGNTTEENATTAQLNWLAFSGCQIQFSGFGRWAASGPGHFRAGGAQQTMPLVLYDRSLRALALSPSSNYFNAVHDTASSGISTPLESRGRETVVPMRRWAQGAPSSPPAHTVHTRPPLVTSKLAAIPNPAHASTSLQSASVMSRGFCDTGAWSRLLLRGKGRVGRQILWPCSPSTISNSSLV
eukprot:COSAG04_NODE_5114_length_1732_cov_0.740355_1_plen_494_part_00